MTIWRRFSLFLRVTAYIAGLAGLLLTLRSRMLDGGSDWAMRLGLMLMVVMFVLFLSSYLLIGLDILLRPARPAAPRRRGRSFLDLGRADEAPSPPRTGNEPPPARDAAPVPGKKPPNGH